MMYTYLNYVNCRWTTYNCPPTRYMLLPDIITYHYVYQSIHDYNAESNTPLCGILWKSERLRHKLGVLENMTASMTPLISLERPMMSAVAAVQVPLS